jgi:hypothetical protein
LETRYASSEEANRRSDEGDAHERLEESDGGLTTGTLTTRDRSSSRFTLLAVSASTAFAARRLDAPKVRNLHSSYPQQRLTLQGELFGNSAPANTVDGGQAEYVRCPLADTTFVLTPDNIPEEMLVLMADIFPTGYFAASRYLKNLSDRDRKEFTVVCVGCGPVGICAITAALTMVDKV